MNTPADTPKPDHAVTVRRARRDDSVVRRSEYVALNNADTFFGAG